MVVEQGAAVLNRVVATPDQVQARHAGAISQETIRGSARFKFAVKPLLLATSLVFAAGFSVGFAVSDITAGGESERLTVDKVAATVIVKHRRPWGGLTLPAVPAFRLLGIDTTGVNSVILFKNTRSTDEAKDRLLLAHEESHALQISRLGRKEFVIQYVKNNLREWFLRKRHLMEVEADIRAQMVAGPRLNLYIYERKPQPQQ